MNELPKKLFIEYQSDKHMIHIVDENQERYLSTHESGVNEETIKELIKRYDEHETLIKALEFSEQTIGFWGHYAGKYFQEKHGLQDDIKEIKQIIKGGKEKS